MERLITAKEYDIHFYEVDYKKQLLITSIVDYLGDISIQQSEDQGIGIEYLEKNRLAWVLYKWNITMERYPKFMEKITIRTWPYSFRRFYAFRQFDILDSKGEQIGRADSAWFLLNLDSRKPQKINDDMYRQYRLSYEDNQVIEFEKLIQPERCDEEKEFNVRYSDIDTNRHVNNAKYIAWCIETVPIDIVTRRTLKNIQVQYEKETTYGETVKILTEIIKNEKDIVFRHKVQDKEGNRLTLVKSTWE